MSEVKSSNPTASWPAASLHQVLHLRVGSDQQSARHRGGDYTRVQVKPEGDELLSGEEPVELTQISMDEFIHEKALDASKTANGCRRHRLRELLQHKAVRNGTAKCLDCGETTGCS